MNVLTMDRENFMNLIGHDRELLVEVTNLFKEDSALRMAELKEALAESKLASVERAAHALKGMIGNFSAPVAYELAREVESLARSGQQDNAAALVDRLDREIHLVNQSLFEMVQEEVQ